MKTHKYPFTKTEDIKEEHFGVMVEDPYRWMEDESSSDLKQWIDEQVAFTETYLGSLANRDKIAQGLKKLYNYPKYGMIIDAGNRLVYSYNTGLQQQSVYYVQCKDGGEPIVMIDPNTLSLDGTVAVTMNSVSHDHRYMAMLVSKSGSDWQTLKVFDFEAHTLLDEALEGVKFTQVAWFKDGFFYSRYAIPEKGKELSAKNENMTVFYHRLGTPQSEDRAIFNDPQNPLRYNTIMTSEDERYVILSISEGTYGNEIWYKDLNENADPFAGDFTCIFKGFEGEADFLGAEGDLLFFITDRHALKRNIVTYHVKAHERSVCVQEEKNTLEHGYMFGSHLVLVYLKDVVSLARVYDLKGKFIGNVELPGIGSIYSFTGNGKDDTVYFTYGSFVSPLSLMRLSLKTLKTSLFKASELPYEVSDYTTEQIFCTSKDGTQVPVFLTYKKGLTRTGDHPTLLYAYGGFNVSLPPAFSPANIFLAEQGGIYAQANVRGGSEYGEQWHKEGMLLNKQNVFDDFISVAEALIEKKYTSKDHLAIQGGSNGGLLMGAVVNQRPDLFNAVFPAVGVMDMLRYHTFTIGWGWMVEYGNPEEEMHFHNIYAYSPLHNVAEKDYPKIMVMTADHDDRVVPAHSFKYIASLQAKNTSEHPMLIRIDKNAGHGAGKSMDKIILEQADKFAFMGL